MISRRSLPVYSMLIASAVTLLALLLISPKYKNPSDLIIFDVHTDSPRIVKDDGSIEFADYVRIRNMTDHTYDLTGLFLSDSRKNYRKLPLDGIEIESGDSVMVKLDPSWNFALKRNGNENVYLSDEKGATIYKYSSRMKPDAPELSADSGFYDNEFYLKMSVKGDYSIYYTLDGNEPDESSMTYSEPIRIYDRSSEPNNVVNVPNTIKDYYDEEYIDNETGMSVPVEKPIEEPVDKAFIIRAVAMDEYGNRSEIVDREFFFCGTKYRNVISIVADRNDLFGDYGILSTGKEYDEWYQSGKSGEQPTVNFHRKGREWEVPATMSYYRDHTKVIDQKCGLKLQGRKTRDRRIKNFQLRARNSYSGSDVFEYDFFDNEPYRSDGIILDDSYKESLFFRLVEGENIVKQRTTDKVALFVNGEFWNNIYIRQRIDERFFADHYDIQPDNLIVLSESFPEIGADNDETAQEISQMYIKIDEFAANNDLSQQENYEEICTMLDIDSYIEYLALNTWVGNTDWGEFNNDLYWRTKVPDGSECGDGRFRWILHDGDYAFNSDFDIIGFSLLTDSPLFPSLMHNYGFRSKLATRMTELGDTVFSDESVSAVLDSGKWDSPELTEIRDFFATRRGKMESITESVLDYKDND